MPKMMKVKFIGHSGIAISEGDDTILIDPWFYSSEFDYPVLEGILPPNRSIDFQIPEPRDKIENFKPRAIFVSHFHTHHSPLKDIRQLLKQRPGCVLGFPQISDENKKKIQENLGEEGQNVELVGLENNQQVTIGTLKITALTHVTRYHLAFLIEGEHGRILHLTDAKMNRFDSDKRPDVLWSPYQNLSPDMLFIASGSHTSRFHKDEAPLLALEQTLTPLEAARLTTWINPKVACIFGLFNQSIWKNRLEYVLPTHVVEEQFDWALRHMGPHIRCLPVRPGFMFEVESGKKINLNLLENL